MRGAVTASSREAADAGAAVLGAGGNAVDAAIAAALATCVADPSNTGIAGYGGYMLVQRAGDERAQCIAFPLCAPSNRTPETLARKYPETGPAASSVPNVIGGLARALRDFGTRPWTELCLPAIALARDGVAANPPTMRALELHRNAAFVTECFQFDTTRPGVFFRQPALAATLERMAAAGPDWFYRGPLAQAAHAAWRAADVDMPHTDWTEQADTVSVEDAAALQVAGAFIQAAPLGLSGSACLFGFVAAAQRIAASREFLSGEGLAEMASAMARVWQYRFTVPGANEFEGRDLHEWIDAALAHVGSSAAAQAATHTAHLNAIDADGTMAALTFTHGPSVFGGRWAIPGTGVIMNGGMHNFTRPTVVQRRGRWFGVSNMTPAVVVTSSKDRIAIGCPGARRIPANIAMALARHLFGGQSLRMAVAGGRLHAEDATLAFGEADRLEPGTVDALRGRFTRFEAESGENYYGPLTAIRRSGAGDIETAVDDRRYRGFARSLIGEST